MKKKLILLSRWSFALAFGVFTLSYCLYHYLSPDGTFTSVYQTAATKPVGNYNQALNLITFP